MTREILGSESSQGVSDRRRRLELATPESAQQLVESVAKTAGWQGNFILDGAALAFDDMNTDTSVLQQSDHGRIVSRHQCGEPSDAFLPGTIGKAAQ